MNNKAVVEFGFRRIWENSADLGRCYLPRPSASVDNTLLDLQNSSYPTQPHSIIAKYCVFDIIIYSFLSDFSLDFTLSTILSVLSSWRQKSVLSYLLFSLSPWRHAFRVTGRNSQTKDRVTSQTKNPVMKMNVILTMHVSGETSPIVSELKYR